MLTHANTCDADCGQDQDQSGQLHTSLSLVARDTVERSPIRPGEGQRAEEGETVVWRVDMWHMQQALRAGSRMKRFGALGCIYDTMARSKTRAFDMTNEEDLCALLDPTNPYAMFV